jgi:hypothetical protein
MENSKIEKEVERLEKELAKGREMVANGQRQVQNFAENCLRIEGAIATLKNLLAPQAPKPAKEEKVADAKKA